MERATMRHALMAAVIVAANVSNVSSALAQQPVPQPELPRMPLTLGLHVVQAEVANTFQTRGTGLMMRKTMAVNHGMLFVFPTVETQCMWMRNTLLPLSVAFVDPDGVITNIADMQPQNDQSHCSTRPARFALEMNQGWFAGKGIKAGVKLGGLDKAPGPK